jgi:hypothetical protein
MVVQAEFDTDVTIDVFVPHQAQPCKYVTVIQVDASGTAGVAPMWNAIANANGQPNFPWISNIQGVGTNQAGTPVSLTVNS